MAAIQRNRIMLTAALTNYANESRFFFGFIRWIGDSAGVNRSINILLQFIVCQFSKWKSCLKIEQWPTMIKKQKPLVIFWMETSCVMRHARMQFRFKAHGSVFCDQRQICRLFLAKKSTEIYTFDIMVDRMHLMCETGHFISLLVLLQSDEKTNKNASNITNGCSNSFR